MTPEDQSRSEFEAKRFSADAAVAYIERMQKLHSSREWRLTVAICNPGGLTAHQTVEIETIEQGFDWTAGQLIVKPSLPLSMLTPEQVADITKSVRAGGSWHAYEREKKHRAELKAAQARIAELEESRRTYRASEWQSIETAPKDGTTVILGYISGYPSIQGHSEEGYWMSDAARNHWGRTGWFATSDDVLCDNPSQPDVWMPLPAPPLATQTPGCRGTACGTTTGEHSAECVADHLKGLFREGYKP